MLAWKSDERILGGLFVRLVDPTRDAVLGGQIPLAGFRGEVVLCHGSRSRLRDEVKGGRGEESRMATVTDSAAL